MESAVEKYWRLLIKSPWVFDRLIYPTVNLTHLLGCLIDISHTTQPKQNSWNPPQKTLRIAFAISVNSNYILLVAQAKNLRFTLDASIYLMLLISVVRKIILLLCSECYNIPPESPSGQKYFFPFLWVVLIDNPNLPSLFKICLRWWNYLTQSHSHLSPLPQFWTLYRDITLCSWALHSVVLNLQG